MLAVAIYRLFYGGDCSPEMMWLLSLVPFGNVAKFYLFRTASTIIFEQSSSRFLFLIFLLLFLFRTNMLLYVLTNTNKILSIQTKLNLNI